ncbi:hypothetical protein [Merdibacter massiliensis]|uniref:hypothetical protein n=1 Tax=Merdibacter massiliensis TaxID=1871030 RepID=UPI0011799F80|nr:hypothetical protein [Merdibacter massiliensis]
MYTYIAAICSYALCICIGMLFRFICLDCAWLIILFGFSILILPVFYRQSNCKALEIKDFAIALIFTFMASMFIHLRFHPIDLHSFCYLYLCSIIGIVQYASSIRFKTLIHR